jgi:glycine cleavage system H protein
MDYDIPKGLRYTSDNEWVLQGDDYTSIGVTDFAQQQLGDIVYVELPNPGDSISQGKAFGVVESVKAVSDLIAPISGTVLEINEILTERPELINESCYGDGWMLHIKPSDPSVIDSLLDATGYEKSVAEQES